MAAAIADYFSPGVYYAYRWIPMDGKETINGASKIVVILNIEPR